MTPTTTVNACIATPVRAPSRKERCIQRIRICFRHFVQTKHLAFRPAATTWYTKFVGLRMPSSGRGATDAEQQFPRAKSSNLRNDPHFRTRGGSTLLAWARSNLVPGFHRARGADVCSRHCLLLAGTGTVG